MATGGRSAHAPPAAPACSSFCTPLSGLLLGPGPVSWPAGSLETHHPAALRAYRLLLGRLAKEAQPQPQLSASALQAELGAGSKHTGNRVATLLGEAGPVGGQSTG